MDRTVFAAFATATLFAAAANVFSAQNTGVLPADTAALVRADTAFAVDLYHQLDKADGNLFFSPYSITAALAMTEDGAKGQTASDIAKTLHFPFEGARLTTTLVDLMREVDRPGEKRAYQLSIANRLWGQKNYGFLPDFLMRSKSNFGAGLEELNFAGAPDQARQTINAWVAKETQDRIKNLLAEGAIAADTRLVLTNAIYFKAQWADQFNDKATKKEDFKTGADKTVKVDMMHQSAILKYGETDMAQVLELPYLGHELSMLVLLPRKADGLAEAEKQLSADKLQEWLSKTKPHRVAVSLPKFTYTSEFQLKDALTKLGMGIAFSNKANFSNMASGEKLALSAVIHKAFVAVDEKGTEAAAATAVTLRPTAIMNAPPATFAADHPFVFVVRDNRTGTILFMGRVVNP